MASTVLKQLLRGAVSGFIATIPMTAAMEGLRRSLPLYERYALPPKTITQRLLSATGVRSYLTRQQEEELAWSAHYLFGTAMGGIYGSVMSEGRAPQAVRGALFGTIVWATSYLGWLPALRLYSPPEDLPARRNLLMFVAHLVWGVSLSTIDEAIQRMTRADSTADNESDEETTSTAEEHRQGSPLVTAV